MSHLRDNHWKYAACLAALAVVVTAACSLVEFETSPYMPRGVDVVYSDQEQMTFFVWRVGDEVDFDRVEFELFVDGRYQTVEPTEAPFDHEPFECDRNYYCVQFQIDGHWSGSGDRPPVLAHDELHGTLESPDPRVHVTDQTFWIDPLAYDNNRRLMPRMTDWFDGQQIPIRRDFQWGLVEADGRDCSTGPPDEWSPYEGRVDLPRNWTNDTPCLALRPVRHDEPATTVRAPIVESPMLYAEEVDEPIPEIQHPMQFAFLVDLEVTNEDRCQQYVDSIRDEIFSTLDELDAEPDRDVEYYDLGVFRPTDPDGTEYSGCSQDEGSRYPVGDILVEAEEIADDTTEVSSLVVVYLNNLGLPPTESKIEDFEPLTGTQEPEDDPQFYRWAIGDHRLFGEYGWHETTPWAPLEDENFLPSIESAVEATFPLRSTDFDGDDTLPVARPNAADSPQYFRTCSIHPEPVAVKLGTDQPQEWTGETWPWPAGEIPELLFDIEPQEFRNFTAFQETRVRGAYEVCDRNCDHPFPGPEDIVYDSWLDQTGVCQWD